MGGILTTRKYYEGGGEVYLPHLERNQNKKQCFIL